MQVYNLTAASLREGYGKVCTQELITETDTPVAGSLDIC